MRYQRYPTTSCYVIHLIFKEKKQFSCRLFCVRYSFNEKLKKQYFLQIILLKQYQHCFAKMGLFGSVNVCTFLTQGV